MFSLRTRPGSNGYFGFLDAEAFGCSAALAVHNAHRYFDQVELYADERGQAIMAALGLHFDVVHDFFADFSYRPELWMASKLAVYGAQVTPFVHLDLDSYLWAPLPAYARQAQVLAQSSEEDYRCYVEPLHQLLSHGGYLPAYLRDFVATRGYKVLAVNAGAFGGCNTAAIRAFARSALAIITHPANQAIFDWLAVYDQLTLANCNILLEQYLASVYCHQHGIPIAYVLDGARPYFTHLLAESKRHPETDANLRKRVRELHPESYARAQCLVL
ncbi:DUF6734 family protein [Hymenobacter arcticus]